MSMIGNSVQSFSHEVRSIIVRLYIRKGKGLAHEMFSCVMVSNVDLLSSRIVDGILCNVDARGIICHNRYGDGITKLCEWVEVPDCLTRCGG